MCSKIPLRAMPLVNTVGGADLWTVSCVHLSYFVRFKAHQPRQRAIDLFQHSSRPRRVFDWLIADANRHSFPGCSLNPFDAAYALI